MSWFVMAFQKDGNALEAEFELPEIVDDGVVRGLVGDQKNIRFACFPLRGAKIKNVSELLGKKLHPDSFEYFIEFRI